jgi:hypothetical protein
MPSNIMATRLERSCKDFLPNLKFIVNYTNRVQATLTTFLTGKVLNTSPLNQLEMERKSTHTVTVSLPKETSVDPSVIYLLEPKHRR